MQGTVIRFGRRALGPALLLIAQHASAVALGDIEVRSTLGEALQARIPLTLAEGEFVDASCFTLSRAGGNEDMPQLAEGTLTIDAVSVPPALRLRTAPRLFEPALAIRIRAACAGDEPVERQYVVLLDPRPDTAGVEAIPSVTIAATLNARPGDSLQSIAESVFPNERVARASYLEALRDVNPALASYAASTALAEGTPVALPDLRGFAKPRARRPVPPRAAPGASVELAQAPMAEPKIAPPPKAAPAPKRIAAPAKEIAATPKATAPPTEARSAPATKAAAPPSGSGFVLKLSSSEVDLSRTRGVDDRKRALLRERQLVLDADDQVSALLSLRNSMRQLESRVADLQLKLAAMPASLAARTEPAPGAAPPPKATTSAPVKIEPPKVELPKAAPPPPPPAKAEPPKVEPPKVEPPKVELPKAEPPRAEAPKAEAPKPALPVPAAPPAPVQTRAAPAKSEDRFDWAALAANPWLWAAILALAAVLGVIAWRRRASAQSYEEVDETDATMIAEPAFDDDQRLIPPGHTPAERPAMASDAGLSTRLGENSRELRRRYIEERFPEIANRTLALDDAPSLVKGARLFYEDGALPRAVELLQFAIEDRPAEVRTWLALFEIFRLERLSGEFAELARRFHEQHGNTEHWRKVQYFGREIDPANPLYKEDTINTLETIGPREARRLATAGAGFDPIAENWLDAPMDFENEVLANELRQSLMTQAGFTEQDLVPNPMPALRNVEMFTVA